VAKKPKKPTGKPPHPRRDPPKGSGAQSGPSPLADAIHHNSEVMSQLLRFLQSGQTSSTRLNEAMSGLNRNLKDFQANVRLVRQKREGGPYFEKDKPPPFDSYWVEGYYVKGHHRRKPVRLPQEAAQKTEDVARNWPRDAGTSQPPPPNYGSGGGRRRRKGGTDNEPDKQDSLQEFSSAFINRAARSLLRTGNPYHAIKQGLFGGLADVARSSLPDVQKQATDWLFGSRQKIPTVHPIPWGIPTVHPTQSAAEMFGPTLPPGWGGYQEPFGPPRPPRNATQRQRGWHGPDIGSWGSFDDVREAFGPPKPPGWGGFRETFGPPRPPHIPTVYPTGGSGPPRIPTVYPATGGAGGGGGASAIAARLAPAIVPTIVAGAITFAVIAAVVTAVSRVMKIHSDWRQFQERTESTSRQMVESNRRFVAFNASVASAYAQYDVASTIRDIRSADARSHGITELLRTTSLLQDDLRRQRDDEADFEHGSQSLRNQQARLTTFGTAIFTTLEGRLGRIQQDVSNGIDTWFQRITGTDISSSSERTNQFWDNFWHYVFGGLGDRRSSNVSNGWAEIINGAVNGRRGWGPMAPQAGQIPDRGNPS
jgi:hypothetical protein